MVDDRGEEDDEGQLDNRVEEVDDLEKMVEEVDGLDKDRVDKDERCDIVWYDVERMVREEDVVVLVDKDMNEVEVVDVEDVGDV